MGRACSRAGPSLFQPGAALRVEVVLHKQLEGGECEFMGEGTVIEPGASADAATAVSGRFVLRPAR